jgi:TonB-linked SusC/RagA family outer membrane protein
LCWTSWAASAQTPATAPDSIKLPSVDASEILSPGPAAAAFTTAQPLLAQVAGVQVTPFSGAPGAAAAIYIRGASAAILPQQPLYVVDGLPVFNLPPATQARYSVLSAQATQAAFSSPPLLGIPVEDIASIEIVKGAAATAQYGSQGSSGVVRISTRRGLYRRPLRVQYAAAGGVQQVRHRYDLLDAREYATLRNEIWRRSSSSWPALYSPDQLAQLGNGTDWQQEVFRTAHFQTQHVSLDGGTDSTRYYVAADYLHEGGVVRQSGLNRYGLRAHVDQLLTSRLTLHMGGSLSRNTQRLPTATAVPAALLAPPDATVRASDGSYQTNGWDAEFTNPVQLLDLVYSRPKTLYLLAQAGLDYQLNPDLQLSAQVNYGRQSLDKEDAALYPFYDTRPSSVAVSLVQQRMRSAARNYNATVIARYHHAWAGQHTLSATLTFLRQGWSQKLKQQTFNYLNPRQPATPASTDVTYTQDWLRLNSHTAALTYTLRGRYELAGSLRTDARTNALRTYYPGAQLSWHLGEEAWLRGRGGLSQLTAWVGAGRTGTSGQLVDVNYLVAVPIGSGLPPSSPERTTQAEAGLRAGWLTGRLQAEATAYRRRTENAVNFVPLLGPGGFYYAPISNTTVQNQGVELTLTGRWQLSSALTGNTRLTATTNRNQVLEPETFTDRTEQQAVAGQPVGVFYGFVHNGTYPVGSVLPNGFSNAGQVRFQDLDGDGNISNAQTYLHSPVPNYLLNWTQQVSWRRLTLDWQADAMLGQYVLHQARPLLDSPSGTHNFSPAVLNRWTPANQNTTIPVAGAALYPYSGTASYITDYALEKADFLRLSQASLSFEVVRTPKRQLSVWVGGQNVWLLTSYSGFDPNVSMAGNTPHWAGRDASVYPVPRTWLLGLRAQI